MGIPWGKCQIVCNEFGVSVGIARESLQPISYINDTNILF